MINRTSIQSVRNSSFEKEWIKPLYDSYCFSRIPATVKRLLTGEETGSLPTDTFLQGSYDRVVLLLIDGFGLHFLEKYLDEFPFLRQFKDKGIVSKITSQFPSTTVAHLTCLHTGLPVNQSGLYEWFHYEPLVDDMIAPLLFSFAGDRERETLQRTTLSPNVLYPTQTLYSELKRAGVSSSIIYHEEYAFSSFSKTVGQDASIVSFASLEDSLERFSKLWQDVYQKRHYIVFYLSELDTVCHRYGPESSELEAKIRDYLKTLEKEPSLKAAFQDPKTAFILTADHGQTRIDPNRTIYLNLLIPSLETLIQTNQQGKLLVPAGSSRDCFLHIKPEALDTAYRLLKTHLIDQAGIYKTSDLIKQGFFGSSFSSPRFLERVGNLIVLPHKGESIFWYEKGRFEEISYGNHGGLTREEMETIFLFNHSKKKSSIARL